MKFLVVALLAIAAVATVQAEKNVITLTTDSFDSVVLEEGTMLVEFFAPWCGHCKALAPKLETAAGTLKADNIKVGAIDCTVETEICTQFEVRGYPTLKVFRKGEQASDYQGGRETDEIVSFMRKAAAPTVTIITAAEVESIAHKDRVVVVASIPSGETEQITAYEKVAKELRLEYSFYRVSDATAAGITLFKTFDEGKAEYSGDFTEESISEFVKTNALPIMDDISQQNYARYAKTGLPLGFLFVSSQEQRDTIGQEVENVAREHKGKINFVYIDANKFAGFADNLGVKQEWPAFAVQHKNFKYIASQEEPLTGAAVAKLAEDLINNVAVPVYKSEPIPTSQDGPVTVVVNKNFNDIVFGGKNVLIEFYAPWCGHCKQLAPIYDELGEAYTDDEVIIAKMDATANDVPESAPFEIRGFPTIFLVRANGEAVEYEGDRKFEDFVAFLTRNGINRSGAAHDEL